MTSLDYPVSFSDSERLLDRIRKSISIEFRKNNLQAKEIEEIAQSILEEVKKPEVTISKRPTHDDMECL